MLVQRGSGDMSVLASDGSAFAETLCDTPGLATATHEVFPADVDADGYVDVVARSRTTDDVAVRRSTGSAFVADLVGRYLGTRLPITCEVYVLHSPGAGFSRAGPAQR